MITDRWKFTTKITLCGISSLQIYRWNQFKVWLACTLCSRNSPNFLQISKIFIGSKEVKIDILYSDIGRQKRNLTTRQARFRT